MPKSGWVNFKEVKEQVPIADVLERYGLRDRMKAQGDELVGLCPFHEETRPSFKVNITKRAFHCFGCGTKGNVLDFVAKMESCSIREAAIKLADWFGIGTAVGPANSARAHGKDAEPARSERATRATKPGPEATAESEGELKPLTFSLKLGPSHPYFVERGLTAETVATFGLGFCSRGMLKDRIAIPIRDAEGHLVAYAGRWPGDPPEGEPKYKLPEGFKKSLVLFNLDRFPLFRVDRHRPLILVEGYWSVFRLHQLGYPAVALMGRDLSPTQERLLVERADQVVVMMDGDPAGREAQVEIVPRLARHLWVRAVELPEGAQPDTIQAEDLRKLIAGVLGAQQGA